MSIQNYLAIIALIACEPVSAQIMERNIGDFALKLGNTPIRSMAQGLVTPTGGSGAMHGGLDLTHDSGLYMGQWSPSLGMAEGSSLEVDYYLGFKKPFDNGLGYEVGMIRYSYLEAEQVDTYQWYAGLKVMDKRIGAAVSNDFGRSVSSVFIDFGGFEPLGLGLRMQYAAHRFATGQNGADGSLVNGFNDWSMNLSKSMQGMTLNLVYSGSSLNAGACNVYSGHNARCEQAFTIKLASSLF